MNQKRVLFCLSPSKANNSSLGCVGSLRWSWHRSLEMTGSYFGKVLLSQQLRFNGWYLSVKYHFPRSVILLRLSSTRQRIPNQQINFKPPNLMTLSSFLQELAICSLFPMKSGYNYPNSTQNSRARKKTKRSMRCLILNIGSKKLRIRFSARFNKR